METSKRAIKRGEIYRCNLQPIKGHEKDGTNRPILIIQNNLGNKYSPNTIGLCLTTQYTDKDIKNPTNVLIINDIINKLDEDSIVESSQIRILDVEKRLGTKMGELNRTDMIKVEDALKISLGLSETCPSCNLMIFEKVEHCPRCKLKLYFKCECGILLNTDWKFCPFCGKETTI